MAPNSLRRRAKQFVQGRLPLPFRKFLSVVIGRQPWIRHRYWYSMELVRDLAEQDPAAFHRFLWKYHVGYAETYELEHRFGEEKIHPSRQLLFTHVTDVLRTCGVNPESDIRSVFDVGCSMGYLLRHMETQVFPGAEILQGVDIDEYAVRAGTAHLAELGSKVQISHADMEDVAAILQGRRFDLLLCAGVLMYLPQENALRVVRTLLEHAERLVVLTGPAHPCVDNAQIGDSARREHDHTFIHNLDGMVEAAGGRVLFHRWEGEREVNGNTIYFVLAEPADVERASA